MLHTFISRMNPGYALLCFILAAFVTNILTAIMMFGLPAFPRPIPSSATTPKPSSLSLDLSERGDSELQDSEVQDSEVQDSELQDSEVQDSEVQDSELQDSEVQDSEVQDSEVQDSEIQDSSPQPQVNGKSTEDDLPTRSPGNGTNPDEPELSPGAKFSFATIVLILIALSVFIKFACIQRWKRCYHVPIAWWDVYENVMWIVFVFELGVSSLALGRWLMLLCDLWGEAGRKALLIREYFLLLAVVIAIAVPFVLLSMCFQAFRKWYRNRLKVKEDKFVTSLEARGLLTMDDPRAGVKLKAIIAS